jgi:hypothetical protein
MRSLTVSSIPMDVQRSVTVEAYGLVSQRDLQPWLTQSLAATWSRECCSRAQKPVNRLAVSSCSASVSPPCMRATTRHASVIHRTTPF